MTMEQDQIESILRAAGSVGQVSHLDYAPYVTMIERRKKDRSGNWAVSSSKAYMGVDGCVMMARRDHASQNALLSFETVVDGETDAVIRLHVVIDSALYGRVTACAESRKDASGAEGEHPLEVAETSAIGRGLRMYGYGVLPGTGLTSAEDMARVQQNEARQAARASQPSRAPDSAGNAARQDPMTISPRQMSYLIHAYEKLYQVDTEVARQQLNEDCQAQYGHPLAELTVVEGRALALSLRGDQPAKDASASQSGTDSEAQADHWRRRFHARIKELGINHERAKELLQVASLSTLYGSDVEQVLHTLEELLKMQQTGG